MKKRLWMLILVTVLLGILLCSTAAADNIGSGQCGDDVYWELSEEGTLTITGTGPMANYENWGDAPWYDLQEDIVNVDIQNGITSIGDRAFSFCESIQIVTIPSSVTDIGCESFLYCTNLISITIPSGISRIGNDAFSSCDCLSNISVTAENQAFSDVDGVLYNKEQTELISYPSGKADSSYSISSGVTRIAEHAFCYCVYLSDVSIPSSVSDIADNAFVGCNNITSIFIPEGVSNIGVSAFECNNLAYIQVASENQRFMDINGVLFNKDQTQILCYPIGKPDDSYSIPSSVVSIADYAFSGCYNLVSIMIPSCVNSIGDGAFDECSQLSSITIPEGVTCISKSTFAWCVSLESITIPSSVETIGQEAFLACDRLMNVVYAGTDEQWTTIQIESGNECLTANLDVHWVLNEGTLIIYGTGPMKNYMDAAPWYADREIIERVIIQDGITSIGDYSFYECRNLTNIAIPSSVTRIGRGPFGLCNSLTSITIPSNVTSIASGGFSSCYLTDINVDSGNPVYSSMNGVLFDKNQTELICYPAGKTETSYSIPSGVISIAEEAFYNHYWVKEVVIPSGVSHIGEQAFAYCYNLDSVSIPSSIESIGNYAFCDCANLTSVEYTGTDEQWSNIDIGYENDYLIDALIFNFQWTLNDGTLYISGKGKMRDYVWNDFPWYESRNYIESVIIQDGITSIGDNAFYNCSNLTDIIIPSSVTNIGYFAFHGCRLISISIPEGVTRIESSAFAYCDDLLSISIPASITSIEAYAFDCCFSLKNVDYAGSDEQWAEIDIGVGNERLINAYQSFRWKLDNGTLIISGNGPMRDYNTEHAPWYSFRDSIESVIIQEGITSIGDMAFDGCYYMMDVTIPSSVTRIGGVVFQGAGLASITISAGVEDIAEDAFYNCNNLTNISVDPGNPMYSSGDGILFNKNQTKLICYPMGKTETSYSIPSGVENIGNNAFTLCVNLTSITIPSSVTSIEDAAFRICTSLRHISIPESVTSIGDSAFEFCQNLAEITIPSSVTSIGGRAFIYCYNLSSIHVVTENQIYSDINGVLFNKEQTELICYPIGKTETSYTIPTGVTSIGAGAFEMCENLNSITIPEGISEIGWNGFGNCENLVSVFIPSSLTRIGHYAFYNCSSLANVNYMGTNVQWAAIDIGEENEFLTSAYQNLPRYSIDVSIGNTTWWTDSDPVPEAVQMDYEVYNNQIEMYVNGFLDPSECQGIIDIHGLLNPTAALTILDINDENMTPFIAAVSTDYYQDDEYSNLQGRASLEIHDLPAGEYRGTLIFEWYGKKTEMIVNIHRIGNPTGYATGIGGIKDSRSFRTNTVFTICPSILPDGWVAPAACTWEMAIWRADDGDIEVSASISPENGPDFMYSDALAFISAETDTEHMNQSVCISLMAHKSGHYIGYVEAKVCDYRFTHPFDFYIFNEDGTFSGQGFSESEATQRAKLIIPASTAIIESEAFSGIPNGMSIYIPESVCSIADDAFDREGDLTIYGTPGSSACIYALDRGYCFVPVTD